MKFSAIFTIFNAHLDKQLLLRVSTVKFVTQEFFLLGDMAVFYDTFRIFACMGQLICCSSILAIIHMYMLIKAESECLIKLFFYILYVTGFVKKTQFPHTEYQTYNEFISNDLLLNALSYSTMCFAQKL